MVSNIETNYSILDADYAYNIDDIDEFKGGKKVKVYIPVLMPEIDISKKKPTTKHIYAESIIINDNSCRPDIDRNITFDYYVYATISYNSDKSHIVNEKGVVPAGTKFKCNFIQGDISRCFIDSDITE